MNKENWRLFQGSRGGMHKSGLVIHASTTIEEDEYLLKYYNMDSFKGSDIDKSNISKEFIAIMKDKYKDNAHYIIPFINNLNQIQKPQEYDGY